MDNKNEDTSILRNIAYVMQIILFIICIAYTYRNYRLHSGTDDVSLRVDTQYVTRTERVGSPTLRDSVVLRFKTIPVVNEAMRPDTAMTDTASDVVGTEASRDSVNIPIVQHVYADTLHNGISYQAWVSGYDASLDSICINSRTQTLTREMRIRSPTDEAHSKTRRFGLGIVGGWGITQHGFSPFLGVGVTYRLY